MPFGDSAAEAVRAYLTRRQQVVGKTRSSEKALLVNLRGSRLTTRSVARIVKQLLYPKDLVLMYTPTPCATPSAPTCWRRAPTSGRSRRCLAMNDLQPPSATPSSRSST